MSLVSKILFNYFKCFKSLSNKKMNRLRKYAYIMSFCGAAIGAMAVSRSYLSGDNYLGNEELYGKTAIITGSNRGIGN